MFLKGIEQVYFIAVAVVIEFYPWTCPFTCIIVIVVVVVIIFLAGDL